MFDLENMTRSLHTKIEVSSNSVVLSAWSEQLRKPGRVPSSVRVWTLTGMGKVPPNVNLFTEYRAKLMRICKCIKLRAHDRVAEAFVFGSTFSAVV